MHRWRGPSSYFRTLTPALLLVVACSTVSGPVPTPQRTKEATPSVSPTLAVSPTPLVTAAATPEVTPEIPPEVTPVVTPEVTPEMTPEPTPIATPSSSADPATAVVEAVRRIVQRISGGLLDVPTDTRVLNDPPNDLFSFGGTPGTTTPWIDVLHGVGFIADLDDGHAAALSDAMACGTGAALADSGAGAGGSVLVAGTAPYRVACNQDLPFEAGEHAVVVSLWNGPIPDPLPEEASCSWGVQTNVDEDPTTGFPNPPPRHPLTGSDIYHEVLMFHSQANGDFQNYNLATDYRQPPRSDTGQQQGNMGTLARFALGNALPAAFARDSAALPARVAQLPQVHSWVLALIPLTDFGPNYNVHAYCFGDINDRQESLAVDVIDHPLTPLDAFFDVFTSIFSPPPSD